MTRKTPAEIRHNWIKGFHYAMQECEAPNSYITWAAISAIAGCTQRKISIPEGSYEYFTNMYVIFVGPQGIVHKSTVIKKIRKLLTDCGIPVASESQTREALIDQMIKRGSGLVSPLCACPDEFSDFIRPSGHTMIEFLTSIFECPDTWEYTTRLRGEETIEKPFANLLAGTTPVWIANEFDATFVEQGFVGRTIFIHENEPRFLKARPKRTVDIIQMERNLADDLAHISTLCGEFEWEPAAEPWYDHWYEKVNQKERKEADYRLKGHYGRRQVLMQKLAMILQIAESDELVLTLDNLKRAKHELDIIVQSSSKALSAVGRNIYASDLERIYADILANGGMSREEITRRNYSAMDMENLEKQILMLRVMKKIYQVEKNGDLHYYPVHSNEQR